MAASLSDETAPPCPEFKPPPPPASLVPRAAVWAALEAGLHNPITLVIAPGGYGKTTVVASWWAQRQSRPSSEHLAIAWCRIDNLDRHFQRFCTQIVNAMESVRPGICAATRQLLMGRIATPVESVAAQFIQDAAMLPGRLALVLDDYHLVVEPAVHRFVEIVVRQAHPNLAFIVLSRWEPPVSVAWLRSQYKLVEVRLPDLQMSDEESRLMVENLLAQPLAPVEAQRLSRYHEGWGAGIQLLTLALRHAPDMTHFLDELDGSPHPYIYDYFMDEVLAGQPTPVEEFLLRTSLLSALHPTLCAAVCDDGASIQVHPLLDHVVRHNLFVIQLDAHPHLYRYHELFQGMLQARLRRSTPQPEIDAIYCRMAQWYADAGDLARALESYLTGGAPMAAAALLETNLHRLQEDGQWQQLEHLLERLPADLVAQNPALLLARGWLYQFRWQSGRLAATIDAITTLLANPALSLSKQAREAMQAELEVLRCYPMLADHARQELTGRIRHSQRQAGSMRPFLLSRSIQLLARCYQHEGNINQALAVLDQTLAVAREPTPIFTLSLLHTRCEVLFYEGRLVELRHAASRYLHLAEQAQLPTPLSGAHFATAGALYFTGKHDDEVIAHCRNAIERPHDSYLSNLIVGCSLLMDVLVQRGETVAAEHVAMSMREFARQLSSLELLAFAEMLDAQGAITSGRAEMAQAWLRSFRPERVSPSYAIAGLVWGRGMVALGSPGALADGAAGLQLMLDRCRASHGRVWMVELLILQARLWGVQRNGRAQALASLQEALQLGYANGQHRPFLAADGVLDDLLTGLTRHPTVRQAASELLQRRARQRVAAVHHAAQSSAASTVQPHQAQPLAAALTPREQEILGWLAVDLSIGEIASRLHLSAHTVGNHTRNIYAKLGAHSRLDAILRAQAAGLLPTS